MKKRRRKRKQKLGECMFDEIQQQQQKKYLYRHNELRRREESAQMDVSEPFICINNLRLAHHMYGLCDMCWIQSPHLSYSPQNKKTLSSPNPLTFLNKKINKAK